MCVRTSSRSGSGTLYAFNRKIKTHRSSNGQLSERERQTHTSQQERTAIEEAYTLHQGTYEGH